MPLEQHQQQPPGIDAKRVIGLEAWLRQPRATNTMHPRSRSPGTAGSHASASGFDTSQSSVPAQSRNHDNGQAALSQQLPGYLSHPLTATSPAVSRGNRSYAIRSTPKPRATVASTRAGSSVAVPSCATPVTLSRHRQLEAGVSASTPAGKSGTPRAPVAEIMDIDELAGGGGDDEQEAVPLVLSDLDPGKRNQMNAKKEPQQGSAGSSGLNTLGARIPERGNGTSKPTTTLRQSVVSIPVSASAPGYRRSPMTPNRTPALSLSMPIQSYSPSDVSHSAGGDAKTASHVVAVGRRSQPVTDIRIKGGRPKGWKPGMSYREVALRNMGLDGEAAAAILLPPRSRKTHKKRESGGEGKENRPRGRPRIFDKQRPNYVLARRPGRPPLPTIESIQRSIFLTSTASFEPFLCQWAGCRAELQNMATLRKHVMFVHGRAAKTCQWRRCSSRVLPVEFGEETTEPQGRKHGNKEKNGELFREHMEYNHLVPMEWHQGDGFVNNSHLGPLLPLHLHLMSASKTKATTQATLPDSGEDITGNAADPSGTGESTAAYTSLDTLPEDLPRYLLDDRGRQVTPLLRDPLLESTASFLTHGDRARRLKELYRQQQYLSRRPDRGWNRLA